MNKIRIAFILVMLVTLLIPITVQAAGTFYCSTLRSTGGDGTYSNPWACSTNAQFNNVVDTICNRYDGGHLYRIYSDHYVYYRIEWVTQNNENYCTITYQNEYPGYPPDTGPDIPMPLILSAVAGVGAILLVGGLMLRRKRSELA